MVEVIKRGEPKGERIHNVTCQNCDSELRFKEREARIGGDQREGDFLIITCPVCKTTVYKAHRP